MLSHLLLTVLTFFAVPTSAPSQLTTELVTAADQPAPDTVVRQASRGTRVPLLWGLAYIPQGFSPESDGYDVLIHVHGVPQTVIPVFDRSGIPAVLVSVNLGNGSGPYENRFADAASLQRALASLDAGLARIPGFEGRHPRRVALSAWSAGYGAVLRILQSPSNRERVDAVFIADGMHAKLIDRRARVIYPASMAPYLAFAWEAARGSKLMAVSYSEIFTPRYASTRETARYLLQHLDTASTVSTQGIPSADGEMTRARVGSLNLHGFTGADAKAHIQHLKQIDRVLWSELRTRWSRPPEATEPNRTVNNEPSGHQGGGRA